MKKTRAVIATMVGAILMAQPVMAYSADDLYELSHIVGAEAGDAACEVIHQPGQYRPTWDDSFLAEPSEDSVAVAKEILEYGSQLPADCLFQANFVQGSAVYQSFDTIYGTTFICVK